MAEAATDRIETRGDRAGQRPAVGSACDRLAAPEWDRGHAAAPAGGVPRRTPLHQPGHGGNRADFPAGSYVIDLNQPQRRLAKGMLEPQASMDRSFVQRGDREVPAQPAARRRGRQRGLRFYDITAWSLPLSFNLDAYWTEDDGPGGDAVTDTIVPPPPRRRAVPLRTFSSMIGPGRRGSLSRSKPKTSGSRSRGNQSSPGSHLSPWIVRRACPAQPGEPARAHRGVGAGLGRPRFPLTDRIPRHGRRGNWLRRRRGTARPQDPGGRRRWHFRDELRLALVLPRRSSTWRSRRCRSAQSGAWTTCRPSTS